MSTPTLDDALDRLYAAEPSDFVKLRKQLVAELKSAGETTAAFRVSDRQKPSKTESAINRVARAKPKLLQDFVEKREQAAAAQSGGRDPTALREALESYRARLSEVVHAVLDELQQAGTQASPAERRRIAQTLETAAADPTAREELVRGRIGPGARDADPIAALAADARAARDHEHQLENPEQKRERLEAERREKAERRERLSQLKKKVARLEREIERARAALERAREELERSQAKATTTARELEALTAELAEARSALNELE